MKSLELELKERLLIVQIEGDITTINLSKFMYHGIHNGIRYEKMFDETSCKRICLGSELTEDIAKQYVEEIKGTFIPEWKNYNTDEPIFEALDSFISAIEAKGWYWDENPLGEEPKRQDYKKEVIEEIWEKDFLVHQGEWQEAEEKTFHPEKCLIFKIVE